MFENEIINRVINKVHEINLSSLKRQRYEITTRLALIREQTKQT